MLLPSSYFHITLHLLTVLSTGNAALASLVRTILPRLVQVLGEFGLGANFWSFPVHNVNGDGDDEGETRKQRGGILQRSLADVLVQGRRVHGGYTRKEITSKIVTTGC